MYMYIYKSVGHIQCYCSALQLPRIAIHHGIWRELMFSIRKSSTELNNASEPRWHFPSALSPEAYAEWGLYKILEYMGLHEILPPGSGKSRAKLRKDIEEYHIAYAIDFDDTDIDTFVARRPDGVAFDKEKKLCILLEYTRAMDTNEDWAEKKEQEKNDRYSSLLGFINHLSHRERSGWKASQTNFTTGVRGSLHTNQFLTRLESLGVKNTNTREAIRNRTVQKNPLYVGHDPQVFLHRIKLQNRLDTPKPTHRNRQQEHGKIQSTPPTTKVVTRS